MSRILFLVVFSLLISGEYKLISQSNGKHSKTPPASDKMEAEFDSLYKVAKGLFTYDMEASRHKAEEILRKGREYNSLRGISDGYNLIGTYFFYTGQPDSTLFYFEKSLDKRKELGDSAAIASSLGNIASIFLSKGEYDEALSRYFEAAASIPKSDDPGKASNFQNIGTTYLMKGDYAMGLEYTLKAYEIYHALDKNSNYTGGTLYNLGTIYKRMLDYDAAMDYYLRALEIYESTGNLKGIGNVYLNVGALNMNRNSIDTAMIQFEIANAYFDTLSYVTGKAGVLTNKGLAYYLLGDYDQSLKNFQLSIELWEQLENDLQKAETLARIGQMQIAAGNYEAAIESYTEAKTIFSGQPDVDYEVSYGLARAYEGLGQYDKALPYQTRSLFLKDSINLERIQLKNAEAEYLINKSKIETLEKENELLDEKRKKSSIILITSVAILLLIITLLVFISRIRRINQMKRLAEKEAKIKQNELESLLKDQELISIRNVLEMQDKERKRIAQDLHDRLGSTLSMVKLHFENTSKRISALEEQNRVEYEKANSLLDEAVAEVRKIAYNLNSGMLKNFGLVAALEELTDTLRNSGHFEVEFITHKLKDRMPMEFEASVYRVIQELISNIIRHAEATEISIQLLRKEDVLQVEVSDNGRGFNSAEISKSSGMGLKNIESRLHKYGGKLELDSQVQRGTTVFIHLPIPV